MTNVITFQRDNPQEDFTYIAKSIEDKKYIIGYIVVEQPWYTNPKEWTYYIFTNEYVSAAYGSMRDLGLKKTIVDPDTIEPYTQIAKIKYNQSIGVDTMLVKDVLKETDDKDNIIAFIGANDEIPYELWA